MGLKGNELANGADNLEGESSCKKSRTQGDKTNIVLLYEILLPLHGPDLMVEWRDQIPVLQVRLELDNNTI